MAVGITGVGLLCALGTSFQLFSPSCAPVGTVRVSAGAGARSDLVPVMPLSEEAEERITKIRELDALYGEYDRAALLSLAAARAAWEQAGWGVSQVASQMAGVFIGSARGATGVLERSYERFLVEGAGSVGSLTSPTTTGGSLSSIVARDLPIHGPAQGFSMTCVSGLYAIATGVAYLRAGMVDLVIAGGAEAPLTPFTIAQMKALRIYSRETDDPFPCRPLGKPSRNSLVLGEGACALTLERPDRVSRRPLAVIRGIGFGREAGPTLTGSSRDGAAFVIAMQQALQMYRQSGGEGLDCLVLHAPGTVVGDAAELAAVRTVFGGASPYLFSTKHLTGHTFGASGAISIAIAVQALQTGTMPEFPYPTVVAQRAPSRMRAIMVNSAGFGGNVVSLIVSD